MNQVTRTPDRQAAAETQRTRQEPALWPPVDVIEDSSGITLLADMPGVPRDKLNLRVESDTLTIEGDLGLEVPQGMEASHAEVHLARYRRAFTLSKELDAEKVSAELAHGVLRVRIPKAEHAQPRRITVNVG
jgi:HSP20 family protein